MARGGNIAKKTTGGSAARVNLVHVASTGRITRSAPPRSNSRASSVEVTPPPASVIATPLPAADDDILMEERVIEADHVSSDVLLRLKPV